MKDAEGTLSLMEEMGIPLMVHGETHGFVMDRERSASADGPGLLGLNLPWPASV